MRLPPARSAIDEQFVVCRLQELGGQRNTPPFVCFIDLPKVYYSIGRELLCEALTHFSGVPTQMLTKFRYFHKYMLARVRTGDGEHWE